MCTIIIFLHFSPISSSSRHISDVHLCTIIWNAVVTEPVLWLTFTTDHPAGDKVYGLFHENFILSLKYSIVISDWRKWGNSCENEWLSQYWYVVLCKLVMPFTRWCNFDANLQWTFLPAVDHFISAASLELEMNQPVAVWPAFVTMHLLHSCTYSQC